ncbi:amidase [Flaviflagellibacter deserti]|uniref:Amidase n=1 Tax=Flaviflagellibacter deserti TaxID=2267266 RepID=A0ABV9Z1G5_9HYPH
MSNPPSLLEARLAFSEGRLTPREYVLACTAKADEVEPWLKSFVTRVANDRLEVSDDGPLGGIPVGVKDIIDTAGLLTTNGSAAYQTNVPSEDADIIARIKALGGTIFGKTVTTEFAWRHPGPTVNPWNRAHTPGGSSSGSAASVAAGIVPLALGTQTVGSVVRPAAYCGVVGFKPSHGIVPREGVHPLSGSLDHVGFFTRNVDDMAYAFGLLADDVVDFPDVDPRTGVEPVDKPRLAILKPPFWNRADAEQQAEFERVVQLLKSAGATLEVLELPARFWDADAIQRILSTEAAVVHQDLIASKPDKVSQRIKDLAAAGREVKAIDYLNDRALQAELQFEFTDRLDGFDAALTLSATGEAPEGLDETGDASFCGPASYLGVPALNVPSGRSKKGLPLGVQVVGPYLEDGHTLRVAKWVEQALAAK